MSFIVSIGSVILQSSVNTFGAVIISAQTAARRIYGLCPSSYDLNLGFLTNIGIFWSPVPLICVLPRTSKRTDA